MENKRTHVSKKARMRWPTALLTAALLTAASLLGGCHRQAPPAEKPVVIGVPTPVVDKLDNAQAEFINAVGDLGVDYDQTVCEGERQEVSRANWRNAMAEAYLEVTEAMLTARQEVEGQEGDERRNVIVVEPTEAAPDRGGWSCMQADGQPTCVEAAASDTGRQVYRSYVEGYDLNPTTAGDVLEAFAADIAWANQYITAADRRGEAFGQIRQACQAGDSPLARFFDAALESEYPVVRRDVEIIQDNFVGTQVGVCEALPIFYDNLLAELQHDLGRRMRTGQCAIPQWQVLWAQ